MEIIKQVKARSDCLTLYWLGLEEKLLNESALPEKYFSIFLVSVCMRLFRWVVDREYRILEN